MKTLRKLSKIVYNKQCSMFKRMHRIKKLNSIMHEYLWVKALSPPACVVFSAEGWEEQSGGADITNYKWPSLTLLFQMAQINLAWSNTLIAAIIWRRDLEPSTLQLQQSLPRWAAFIVQLQRREYCQMSNTTQVCSNNWQMNMFIGYVYMTGIL